MLTATAVKGGGVFAQLFLLIMVVAGFNAFYAAVYLIRKGTVRRELLKRKRRFRREREGRADTDAVTRTRSASSRANGSGAR